MGSGFLKTLSNDLKADFPEIKGFSLTNPKYIRLWVNFYQSKIGQQLVDQLGLSNNHGKEHIVQQHVVQISQQPVDQIFSLFTSIPWGIICKS
jgi:hypothetical protein